MDAVWTLESGSRLWSTAPLPGYEPIIRSIGTLQWGLGDVVGAIERPSLDVVVANPNRELDDLLIGRDADGFDWHGPRLLGSRWRLYRITPDTKRALSPQMVVTEVEADVGSIRMQLLADEMHLLGPSRSMATLEDWRTSVLQVEWAHETAASWLGLASSADLASVFRAAIPAFDQRQIPWIYGPAVTPAEVISEDGVWRLVGMITPEHLQMLQWASAPWERALYARERRPVRYEDRVFPVVLRSSTLRGLLLVLVSQGTPDVDLLYVLDFATTDPRLPDAIRQSPMQIIRRIIEDHSAGSIDSVSADIADVRTRRLENIVGGVFETSATVQEVLSTLAPICGIEAYITIDGRLAFSVLPAPEDGMQPVLELDAHDVYPTGPDRIPGASARSTLRPPMFGSVADVISIDWPQSRMDAYPVATRLDHRRVRRNPGIPIPLLTDEGEVRLSGAWIHPPRASAALSEAAEWYGWPIRLITIPTHVSILDQVRPGDIIAWRAPTLPGPERRLGIVRRFEIIPGSELVHVTVGDLGWAGMLRTGVLDTIEQWILYEPTLGTTISLDASAATLELSAPVFSAADVGAHIWVRGSPSVANRRSYAITEVISSTRVRLDPAPRVSEAWGDPGLRTILLMRVADHARYGRQVDGRIAVSEAARLPAGSPAYRFAR